MRFARRHGDTRAIDLAEKLIRKWAESEQPFAQRAVVRWVKIKAVLINLATPAPGVH
jgi:hypothetical protein